MRNLFLILVLVTAVKAGAAQFGLGVVLGEPTGITTRINLDGNYFFHGALAWSIGSSILVSGDYGWFFRRVFHDPELRDTVSPYVGVGGVLFAATQNQAPKYFSTGNSVGLGLRIPLGIEWDPKDAPLGVFVELVPGMGVIPSTFAFFQFGVGVVYYFD